MNPCHGNEKPCPGSYLQRQTPYTNLKVMAAVKSELATLVTSPSRNKLLDILGQLRSWLQIFLHTYSNTAAVATTRAANICPVHIVHPGQR